MPDLGNDVASHNKEKRNSGSAKADNIRSTAKFPSSLLNLKTGLEEWMQQYILCTQNGKVLFASTLLGGGTNYNSQTIFYVTRKEAVFMPNWWNTQKGFSKTKKGQKVIIKLKAIPARVWIHLTSYIDHLSLMPGRKGQFSCWSNLTAKGPKSRQDLLFAINLFFANGKSYRWPHLSHRLTRPDYSHSAMMIRFHCRGFNLCPPMNLGVVGSGSWATALVKIISDVVPGNAG